MIVLVLVTFDHIKADGLQIPPNMTGRPLASESCRVLRSLCQGLEANYIWQQMSIQLKCYFLHV